MLSVQVDRVQASMRLIPGITVASAVISGIDTNHDGVFSLSEEQTYARQVLADLEIRIDGTQLHPRLVSWSFPPLAQMRDGLGEIHIDYTVELPRGRADRTFTVTNHHLSASSVYLVNALVPGDPDLRIVAQQRNPQQSVYQLRYRQLSAGGRAASPGGAESSGGSSPGQFKAFFELGMRHIAEGTDHLLFLLALLLPAPLLVAGSRWGAAAAWRCTLVRILSIVTAFTIGHSLTLSLAAFGAVRIADRPVEALIALSILASAVHALRPVFPGKEARIAASFGLVHGLAFASTLDRLGLAHWQKLEGILAFNLGIETMQLLVVVAVLPTLLLLSTTRYYPILRTGGATFAAIAATGWLIERLTGMDTGVDAAVNAIARHGVALTIGAAILAIFCKLLPPATLRLRVCKLACVYRIHP
jgi:hypothetical protein